MTTTAAGGQARTTTIDGWRLGGGTFTRLPMTPPGQVNAAAGRVAILTAPVWGLLLGAVAGGATAAMWWWFGRDGSAPLVAAGLCAVVGVTSLAWLSRGLHLDGLADTFDGFASMRRGPHALAIMRDPNVGALGVAGLLLVVLLQVSSLTVVIASSTPAAVAAVLAAAGLVSRAVLPWATRVGTPSADSGLGSVVVGQVGSAQAGLVVVVSGILAVVLMWRAGIPPAGTVAAVVVAVIAVGLLRRQACRRFGVITGDVLGAMVEGAVTCVLIVAAMAA